VENPSTRKIQVAFFSEKTYALFKPEYTSSFGGAEVDQYNLSLYLAKNPNIDVSFYVGDFGQTNKPEFIDGVRVKKIPLFGWHNKNFYHKVTYAYHLFKNLWKCDADIVLTEMANDLVGWVAVFFKIFKRKHLIHRLASDRDTEYSHSASGKRRRTYYLYRLGLKKADMIYSQTKQQQKQLKDNMGFDSQVVPNGFFIDRCIDSIEKRHILWVGRCASLKRPELFVELAWRIPHKRFVMIMPPPSPVESEDFRRLAADLVERAKGLPNMQYIEHVPFNEIQNYYNQAQLFVNTSEYEGFPNAFVQSCLGGTPIASLKVDPDDFITQNQLGIACENNFNKLLEFVQNLTDQQTRFLGANALEYGRKHHDISVMGGEYENAFKKIFNLDSDISNC
jgi:glycosyltransferase involved in cell wall biosynthesis